MNIFNLQPRSKMIFNIIISICSVLITALLCGVLTKSDSLWYLSLSKPTQFMPDIVFPIAWNIIYILMIFTIFYFLQNEEMTWEILLAFLLNGICNILWCLVFFTLQQVFLGLIIIVINLILSFILLLITSKDMPFFAILLFIYPLWLSLATALNLSIWILN